MNADDVDSRRRDWQRECYNLRDQVRQLKRTQDHLLRKLVETEQAREVAEAAAADTAPPRAAASAAAMPAADGTGAARERSFGTFEGRNVYAGQGGRKYVRETSGKKKRRYLKGAELEQIEF